MGSSPTAGTKKHLRKRVLFLYRLKKEVFSVKSILKGLSTWERILCAGTLAGGAVLFLMQAMTTFTYDDYYYAVFLRSGLGGFVEQNIGHYLVRNGRVLVHCAAELLLAGPQWVYSGANLILLASVFLLGLKWLRGSMPGAGDLPVALGGAMALVLMNGYQMYRSWLLCPADSVNYMLPMIAVLAMLLSLDREKPLWAVFWALLCGASTELYAAVSMGLILLELLRQRVTKGRWSLLRLICAGCILAGLATILLSPATQERVGAELSIRGVGLGFLRYANSIAVPGRALGVLTVLTLVLGTGLEPRSILRRLSVVMAALLALGWVLPRSTVFTAVVFGLLCAYLLAWAAAMLWRDAPCAFLVLGALGAAAVMTLSDSGSVRVTIPFLLFLEVAGVHLLMKLANRRWFHGAVAAVLTVALLLHIPNLVGVAKNRQIMAKNEQTLAADGGYEPYDPVYCTQQAFMSTDFQRVYLAWLELEGVTPRYHYSYGPEVTIGGRLEQTVLAHDRTYVPLRAVIEAAGGTVQLISDSFLELRLGDRYWIYQAPILTTPEGTVDVTWDLMSLENRFYISTAVLENVLGLIDWED